MGIPPPQVGIPPPQVARPGLPNPGQKRRGEAGRIYLVRLPDLAIRQEQMEWPDAQAI